MRYLFYKIRYRLTKQIIKFVMSFFMVFTILFSSFYSCITVSYGSEVLATAGKIVGYIGTTLGIVDKATGGGVTKMGGSTTSKIEEWFADNFNSGEIYKNASGDYVFSGTATQELYNALDSDSTIDARVISSFPGTRVITNKVTRDFNTPINSFINNKHISNFAIFYTCPYYDYYDNGSTIKKTVYWTKALVCDLSNVAYIIVSDSNTYTFYNSEGRTVSVATGICAQNYRTSESGDDDSFGKVKFGEVNISSFSLQGIENSAGYNQTVQNTVLAYNTAVYPAVSGTYCFRLFPYLPDGDVYSNKSLIVARNGSSAISIMNGGSRVINNYYTTLPSVSADTINNNDWDSVYNSYVTNVNNESNTYYNSTNDSFDMEKLRKSMKKYSDNVQSAIESGAENIAEQVNYLNTWCERIYEVECEIRDLIQANETGGGSATDLTNVENTLNDLLGYIQGTSGDIATIKGDVVTLNGNVLDMSSDLASIINYLNTFNSTLASIDNKVDYLEDSYTVLSEILQYMLQNPWGSSGGGSPFVSPTDNPWSDWFNYIRDNDNFPYESIISKFDILKNLLMASAPFCFLTFASAFVNSLVVEPVEPTFTIPVKMNNSLVTVDEEMELDLTMFDSILPITDSLLCILFTICLLWSSIYIISHLLNIFQLK